MSCRHMVDLGKVETRNDKDIQGARLIAIENASQLTA
jgi:hypothetical protein